jgi:acyl-CoA thioester hydrolase
LTRLRSRHVAFAYEVRHVLTDERLATGSSEHICVDLEGRMAKIPEEIVTRLVAGAERLAAGQVV